MEHFLPFQKQKQMRSYRRHHQSMRIYHREAEQGSITRNAALIMAAQKVEHYEIVTYGGLVQFAIIMKRKDIAELLDKTLMEEEDTDQLLTDIAEVHINIEAEGEDKYSWNKKEEPVAEEVE